MGIIDIFFETLVNSASGDLVAPIIFILLFFAGFMVFFRFPLGGSFVIGLSLMYGFGILFPVSEVFFTAYVVMLFMAGMGIGLFFWHLFSNVRG